MEKSKSAIKTLMPPECIICNGRTTRDLKAEAALDLEKSPEILSIFKCANCGHRQLYPGLSSEQLSLLYNDKYFEDADRGYSYENQMIEAKIYHANTALEFKSMIRTGNILDIGCATGDFLLEAEKIGLHAYGIDVSSDAIIKAKNHGLNVSICSIDDLNKCNKKFDGVHISHVLEHYHSPIQGIDIIKNLMKNGSIIYIEVPNQFNSVLDNINKFNSKKTFDVFSVHHQQFFTIKSMEILLANNGFDIIRIGTYLPKKRTIGFHRKYLLNCILYFASMFNRGDVIYVWAKLKDTSHHE